MNTERTDTVYAGAELPAFAEEISRVAHSKRDFIVSAASDKFGVDSNINIMIGEFEKFGITDHAHSQISSKLGIPKKYYDRMKADAPTLLKDNINH